MAFLRKGKTSGKGLRWESLTRSTAPPSETNPSTGTELSVCCQPLHTTTALPTKQQNLLD